MDVIVDPGVDVVDPGGGDCGGVVVDPGAKVVEVDITIGVGDFSLDVVDDAVVVVEETPGASDVEKEVDDEVEVVSIGAGEAVDDIVSIGIGSAVEENASVDAVDESSGVISSVGVAFVDTTRVVDTGVTLDTAVGEEGDVDIVVGAGGDTGVDAVSSEVLSISGCAVDISTVVETSIEVAIVDFDDGVDVLVVEGGVELMGVTWEVVVVLDASNSA